MKAITDPGRVIDVRPWENDDEPLRYGDGTPVLHALVLFDDEPNLRQLTLDRGGDWELEVGEAYRFEVSGLHRPDERPCPTALQDEGARATRYALRGQRATDDALPARLAIPRPVAHADCQHGCHHGCDDCGHARSLRAVRRLDDSASLVAGGRVRL